MNKFNFLTEAQYQQLVDNGKPEHRDHNHAPVVRLFLPYTNCVWLLSEIDAEDDTIAFGLCDLALGYPELGYVSLVELSNLVNFPFKVTADKAFFGKYPMSVYCDAARVGERISTDDELLTKYHAMFLARKTKSSLRPPQPGL